MTKQLSRQLVIFIFLTFAFAAQTNAATLHALLVIMNGDKTVGDQCDIDRQRVQDFLGKVQRLTPLTVSPTVYQSKQQEIKVDTIWQWIQKLSTTKDDVIFFFYSGHGGRTPQYAYWGLTNESMPAPWLQTAMSNKPARLKILITNCCNIDIERREKQAATPKVGTIDESESYLMENLFLYSQGFLYITSSAPTQYSFCTTDNRIGGFFVKALFQDAYQQLSKNHMPCWSWQNFFDIAQQKTQAIFAEYFRYNGGIYKDKYNIVQKTQKPHCYQNTIAPAICSHPGDSDLNDRLVAIDDVENKIEQLRAQLDQLYASVGLPPIAIKPNTSPAIKFRTVWHDTARLYFIIGYQVKTEYGKDPLELQLRGRHFSGLSRRSDLFKSLTQKIDDLRQIIGVGVN